MSTRGSRAGGRGANNNSTPKAGKKKGGKGTSATKPELDCGNVGDISSPNLSIDASTDHGQLPSLNSEHRDT